MRGANTLVEAGSDDVSCKQLLDAARARDSKEGGAEVAFATASVAVTAAAVGVDLKAAQKKLQETFSK